MEITVIIITDKKTIMKNKILSILLISTLLISFFSCSGMNDKVDKYLTGEKIYAGMVDSIVVLPGYHRLKLSFYVTAQRIDYLRVFWNNNTDSMDVSIKNKSGVFTVMLNNLDEQNYLFNVYSYDQYGNKSLLSEASGTSYGETYQVDLTNRDYTAEYSYYNPATSTMTIYWKPQFSNIVKTVADYINTSGKKVYVTIPADATISTLTDLKSDLHVNSYYIPYSNALDTIAPATPRSIPVYYEQSLDKSSFKVLAYSSRYSSSYAVEKALDGNPTTAWRAKRYSNPNWFIIDLGKDTDISAFGLYRWQSTNDNFTYTDPYFYYAADGVLTDPTDAKDAGWKTFGKGYFDNLENEQFCRADGVVKARYLMFYCSESNNTGYFNVGELNVYSPVGSKYQQ
jgi:hypothetical protein